MLKAVKYLYTLLSLWLKNIHVRAYRFEDSDSITQLAVVYNLLLAVPTLLVLLTTVPYLSFFYILGCLFATVLITSVATPFVGIPMVLLVNRQEVMHDIRDVYNQLKKEADNYIKENK